MTILAIQPMGEDAVLVRCPSEADAIALTSRIRSANPPWLRTIYPAYDKVGAFYDPDLIEFNDLGQFIEKNWIPASAGMTNVGKLHQIPVCYDLPLDMNRVCEFTELTRDDVIHLHTSTVFTVYAVGFVPGFPYLGYLPDALCGVPRLASPRVRVEPGSVGLTGRQTGIYPLPRPGGWNLIGRTPLTIVDPAERFFPISVGDRVQFTRIDEAEYRRLEGERLLGEPGA